MGRARGGLKIDIKKRERELQEIETSVQENEKRGKVGGS